MRKVIRLNIALFIIASFLLIGCQSELPSCENTTNPFPTPSGFSDDFSYNPNIEISQVCSFTGEITRGQVYKHKIKDGLIFCLTPSGGFWQADGGWTINISDETGSECDDNFAGIVTPPYHGNNATFVQGWQFRNPTNTADNQENALRTRYFNFIFNQEDFETIFFSNYQTIPDESPDLTKIPRSRGVLTITDLRLGNLVPNERAWIESMEFKVKIYLPAE